AEASGHLEVDVVEAGGPLGDHPGAARGELLQDARAEVAVDAGGDHLVAGRDGGGVLVEEDAEPAHRVVALEGPLDQGTLVGLHTECQDLHAFPPGSCRCRRLPSRRIYGPQGGTRVSRTAPAGGPAGRGPEDGPRPRARGPAR